LDSEGYRLTLPVGSIIFSEGQIGDCAYIIHEGEIGLSTNINDCNVEFTVARSGDLIGEMALIDDGTRLATAKVLKDVELLVIPKDFIKRVITEADPTMVLLVKLALERYRNMRIRLEQFSRGEHTQTEDTICASTAALLTHQTRLTATRLDDERKLQTALDQREFQLFYQPIIDFKTDRIAGCEALIRWIHNGQIISPLEFIGLAEKTGQIEQIGYWIFEEATRVLPRFKAIVERASPGAFFLSINLSSRQIESASQVNKLKQKLLGSGMDLSSIKLEITESVLMTNPPRIASVLTELKQFGTQIALDDFGTGYSSFSYLHRFPIDNIKIDQSFVATMRENPTSEAIVRTLCSLARSLGMTTIAEGIEKKEDIAQLKGFGCDFGQGYIYSKPVPEAEFIKLIEGQAQSL